MKLNKSQASGYFRQPNPDAAGVLLYGSDGMRVALRRQEIIATLVGPNGEEEMRLTRMAAAGLSKEPAQIQDALKAIGFFPGARVAFVEDATEKQAPILLDALASWVPGDAQLVITAGQLKPTSKLRKAFEAHPQAYAIGIYDDPPDRSELEQTLKSSGISVPDNAAMSALQDLARAIEPGDFRQTLEKLALYKFRDDTPITLEDIANCAPTSIEAEVDDVLMVVCDGQANQIGPVMARLQSQGVNAVTLCIGAMRHFRTLHRIAVDTTGRPQVWGPNRDRMMGQARKWGAARLEAALTLLTDTDLQLRSAGQNAPALALVERAFIRLAMMGAR